MGSSSNSKPPGLPMTMTGEDDHVPRGRGGWILVASAVRDQHPGRGTRGSRSEYSRCGRRTPWYRAFPRAL